MTLSNVIIEGNYVSYGTSTVNGVTPISAEYSASLYTSAPAIISNNIFSGQTNNAAESIVILDGYIGNITNNKFQRGSSSINAYIKGLNNTASQFIVENDFDSPTCDGSDENLVKGISDQSIYEKNVNQTSYAIFTWHSHTVGISDQIGHSSIINSQTGIVLFQSDNGRTQYLKFQINNSTQQFFSTLGSLKDVLPKGVKILTAKCGIYYTLNSGSIDGSGLNFMGFGVYEQPLAIANFNVGTNSILDAKNTPNYDSWASAGDTPIDLSIPPSNTLYGTIDFQGRPNSEEAVFTIILNIGMKLNNTSTVNGNISPCVIKYRW